MSLMNDIGGIVHYNITVNIGGLIKSEILEAPSGSLKKGRFSFLIVTCTYMYEN